MIDAIVAPADDRSIEIMRACLVSGRIAAFEEAGTDCAPGLDFLAFRVDGRGVALAFDFGLVMGSSEVMRRHRRIISAPPEQLTRQGKIPKRTKSASSCHRNAPIRPEGQSLLSNIVAHWVTARGHGRIFELLPDHQTEGDRLDRIDAPADQRRNGRDSSQTGLGN